MHRHTVHLGCLLMGSMLGQTTVLGQGGGDQFLDGIGETALIARYVFDGDTKDSSRNTLDATLAGSGAAYVDDPQFGRILSLPGGEGAYVRIPGRTLDGLDTVSVAGWVQLRSSGPACFFDFGLSATSNFFCVPCDAGADSGFAAGIYQAGQTGVRLTAPAVATNRWVHVAVVLDAARKRLTCYVDGQRAARVEDVELTLEQVLNQEDGNQNRVFIGRSQAEDAPHLNAKVHDFRIYSIALTGRQVAVIHRNALSGDDDDSVAATTDASRVMDSGKGIAQPMASQLTGVADIEVETVQGFLPRLPHTLPGQYQDGAEGPDVRVIWSSPRDNQRALTNSSYTVIGKVPGTEFQPKALVTVRKATASASTPSRQLEPFPLGAVTLLPDESQSDTQFMKNRDKFVRGLADTDPDRFLYMFRDAFGQPQPEGARPLGGWDSQTTRLRGHATGHYLTAIAQAYASATYDESLRTNFGGKMDYLIDTLYELSQMSGNPTNAGAPFNSDPTAVPPGPGKAGYNSDLSEQGIRTDYWNWGKGFISAYPPDQFIMLEQGATYGGNNNQIWAPYYTLHKILAGLLDCYEVGGNQNALEVAEGMAQWVYQRLQEVPTSTRISMWNRYIAGEYGGMNEVLARLNRITGNPDYLQCAQLFDNVDFFFGDAEHSHGLARNVDTIRGKHANQHIPQIIGAVETYGTTGNADYWFVAENFWDKATHSYLYSIGGVAGARNPNNAECFTAEPDTLFENGFANGGQNETCATYNLLKLTRQLFLFDPDPQYMNYYEQALYNHILASVAEDNAGNTYHVPLNPAARKRFGNAGMDGFSCCNGTALESSTKLQDSIYFRSKDDSALYVNLFVPSKLTWSARGVTLTQKTSFPYEDTTQLRIEGDADFDLKVRVPEWATHGYFVTINGNAQSIEDEPGSYLSIGRKWKSGDTIEIRMPMEFHLMPVMDQPNIASLFYGPVLLAAQESDARSTWRPVTLSETLSDSITGDPTTLRFQVGDVEFKPFYETYGRSSVYLDVTLE